MTQLSKIRTVRGYVYDYGSLKALTGTRRTFLTLEDGIKAVEVLRSKNLYRFKQIVFIDYSGDRSRIIHILEPDVK